MRAQHRTYRSGSRLRRSSRIARSDPGGKWPGLDRNCWHSTVGQSRHRIHTYHRRILCLIRISKNRTRIGHRLCTSSPRHMSSRERRAHMFPDRCSASRPGSYHHIAQPFRNCSLRRRSALGRSWLEHPGCTGAWISSSYASCVSLMPDPAHAEQLQAIRHRPSRLSGISGSRPSLHIEQPCRMNRRPLPTP